MNIEKIKLTEINEASYNPRKINNDEKLKLKSSLKTFGLVDPIIINLKDNTIIGGHQRYNALIDLSLEDETLINKEFNLIKLGDVGWVFDNDNLKIKNKDYEKALNLALNKINGEWDNNKLKSLLTELDINDFSIELTGFDELDISELELELSSLNSEPSEIVEDDYEVDDDLEITIETGDIYQLGNHRIMCGDSTKSEDVTSLMNGEKADMVFTDPPYGMKKEKEGIKNDNLNSKDLLQFNKKWILLSFENLKENGSWYCWGIDEPLMDIYAFILKPMIELKKISFRNLITWNKGAFGSGGGTGVGQAIQRSYFPADEKCLFVMKGVQGFNNNSDNYFEKWELIRSYLENEAKKVGLNNKQLKEITGVGMYGHWFTKSQWTLIPEEHYIKLQNYYSNAFKKDYDEIKKEYDEIKKEWYATRAYFNNTHDMMTNIWEFQRVRGNERKGCGGHATPKPLKLCERGILTSSREGEIVLDVFGGSGSTLIACEQVNRHCYMMELDPKYCQVIINRWEEFTGEKAKKIN